MLLLPGQLLLPKAGCDDSGGGGGSLVLDELLDGDLEAPVEGLGGDGLEGGRTVDPTNML